MHLRIPKAQQRAWLPVSTCVLNWQSPRRPWGKEEGAYREYFQGSTVQFREGLITDASEKLQRIPRQRRKPGLCHPQEVISLLLRLWDRKETLKTCANQETCVLTALCHLFAMGSLLSLEHFPTPSPEFPVFCFFLMGLTRHLQDPLQF